MTRLFVKKLCHQYQIITLDKYIICVLSLPQLQIFDIESDSLFFKWLISSASYSRN